MKTCGHKYGFEENGVNLQNLEIFSGMELKIFWELSPMATPWLRLWFNYRQNIVSYLRNTSRWSGSETTTRLKTIG